METQEEIIARLTIELEDAHHEKVQVSSIVFVNMVIIFVNVCVTLKATCWMISSFLKVLH